VWIKTKTEAGVINLTAKHQYLPGQAVSIKVSATDPEVV